MAKRTFPMFYEPSGGKQIPVSFWFQNPHPVPVRVAILGRSCTSCSSARLAVVTPEALRAVAVRGAVLGGTASPQPGVAGLRWTISFPLQRNVQPRAGQ